MEEWGGGGGLEVASLPDENGLFWLLVSCAKKIQIKVGAQLYTQF